MRKDDCFELGYISRPHGLNGSMVLVLDVDFPNQYEKLKSLFVEVKGQLVPYFIESLQIRPDKAVIQLEEVDSEEKALGLKNSPVFLPLTMLPSLPEDKYYYHEIVGYQVQDVNEGALGLVAEIIPMPMHNILVMDYQNQEVLIPVTDDVVTKVDKVNQVVYTALPDGLLDIYMNPDTLSEPDDAD